MPRKEKIWLIVTILFAVCLTTLTLSHLVTDPWHQIPEFGGDGAKNTLTYLYHSLYGHGIWFDGMNYPYGEHVVYTDAQPVVSMTLSLFKGLTIADALAVMGWLISLSYVVSIVYLYKILRHFGVQPFVAMLFSGLAGIYTPQLFCIQGHYALSYVCLIPMLFYWIAKYHTLPEKKYAVYIFLAGCIAAFMHPYFLAVTIIWVASYAAGYFIFIKETVSKKVRHTAPLLLAAILVFALVGIVMALTDPHKDRPLLPYGTLEECTTVKQVLTSTFSPLWDAAEKRFTKLPIAHGGEGQSYPGLLVIIIFIVSLIRGVILRLQKKSSNMIVSCSTFSPIWLFMAFAILLFAMGVPFIWNMEWLLDYMSVFRQFRTLGRFSWMFYYIIVVYAIIILNAWYTDIQQKKAFAGYVLMAAALCLWGYEAGAYVIRERKLLNGSDDNYNVLCPKDNNTWARFLKEHNQSPDQYQAILILGFFEIGSEKLWLGDYDLSYKSSVFALATLQLHLPAVDAMMSRSSWSVAQKQVKTLAGPYVHKPFLDDVKSNKPILLLHFDQNPLNPDEAYLLTACEYIGSYQSFKTYAFFPDRLRASDAQYADSIRALLPNVATGDTCLRCNGSYYSRHFDETKTGQPLFGGGAMPKPAGKETPLADIPVKPAVDNENYEFSCWFLLSRDNYKSPYVHLDALDSAGNILKSADAVTKQSTDSKGLWFRAGTFFTLPAACRSIRSKVIGYDKGDYIMMDELMLRPADAVIISKDASGNIMVNNHLFER